MFKPLALTPSPVTSYSAVCRTSLIAVTSIPTRYLYIFLNMEEQQSPAPPPLSSHLFHRAQDLANLKDLVHFTISRKKRSECVEFSHDAADSPQVNRRAVGRRPKQDLRGSVPRWSRTIYDSSIYSTFSFPTFSCLGCGRVGACLQ